MSSHFRHKQPTRFNEPEIPQDLATKAYVDEQSHTKVYYLTGTRSASNASRNFQSPYNRGNIGSTVETLMNIPFVFGFTVTEVFANCIQFPTIVGDDPTVDIRDDLSSVGELTITGTGEFTSGTIAVVVADNSQICFLADTSDRTAGNFQCFTFARCVES